MTRPRSTGRECLRRCLAPTVLVVIAACGTPPPAPVDAPLVEAITPASVREHTELEWSLKAEKMRRHLIPAMRVHGVTLWVIMSRENSVDPALELFGGSGITTRSRVTASPA